MKFKLLFTQLRLKQLLLTINSPEAHGLQTENDEENGKTEKKKSAFVFTAALTDGDRFHW